ncbi:MAG TPA: CAP domain-containing protein, partial [Actinomycetota bacterium]|nr:CAP domain-containing protein [Actinomycetota bacterium]
MRNEPGSGSRARPRHARAGSPWVGHLRMAFLIVFPLLLAWALLPACAKPGGGRYPGQDPAAAAAAAPDAVRLASLVNAERSRHGLPTLSVVPRLSALAGAQSTRMASARRLSSSAGLAQAVQPASAWEEQVRCAPSVEAAHQDLMGSATARRRILSRSFNAIGVGAHKAGCLWVTELLAKVPDAGAAGTARRPARPTTTTAATTTTRAATTTTKPAPRPTTAPTSAPAPAGSQTTAQKLASDLFNRLNAERQARGLAALKWDGDLARVAGDWSAHMASTDNFAHRDLGAAGSLPGMAKFSALGENIAWVEGYPSMGNQLHVGWMKSEGHRANMLQRGFDSVGIGVVCSGGRAWATQNFGRLDSSSAPSMATSTPPENP